MVCEWKTLQPEIWCSYSTHFGNYCNLVARQDTLLVSFDIVESIPITPVKTYLWVYRIQNFRIRILRRRIRPDPDHPAGSEVG